MAGAFIATPAAVRAFEKTPAPLLQPLQSGVVTMIKQAWWTVVVGAISMSGCVHAERVTPAASLPTSVAPGPVEYVVSYPEGRYELRGDGAATPFHWVWIPAGHASPR